MPPSTSYAPYEERQVGLSTRQRLLAALSGLGSVRPGAGFGESFLQGLGGGARNVFLAQNQAQQAAQEYAAKQVEAERQAERDAINKQFMEAQITAMGKAKPEGIVQIAGPDGKPVYVRESQAIDKTAYTAPKEPKTEPLVAVEGPAGPVLVRQSQAEGRAPAKTGTQAADKPATAGERRSAGALSRASGLDKNASDLEKGLSNLMAQAGLKLPYAIQSQAGKKYTQTRKAFTETVLREFSGAAISKDEYDKYDQIFFAQPGDNKDTLKQKQQTRAGILAQLRSMSGTAAADMTRAEFDAMLGGLAGGGGVASAPSGFDPEAARKKYGY